MAWHRVILNCYHPAEVEIRKLRLIFMAYLVKTG